MPDKDYYRFNKPDDDNVVVTCFYLARRKDTRRGWPRKEACRSLLPGRFASARKEPPMTIRKPPGARIISSTESSSLPNPHSVDFPIVGIGASAGGIQALMRLLQGMPADGGMAFVAVLHISPNHACHVDEVLQRSITMPVVQVLGTTPIEKNTVYLISPSNDLSLADGCLHVVPSDPSRRRPVAIDLFFRSLADAHRARSISIILSGMGSDGSMGTARIKEQNGINIVQDPADAEFDEMPRNALATGFVDIVLSVEQMPARLIELRDNAPA